MTELIGYQAGGTFLVVTANTDLVPKLKLFIAFEASLFLKNELISERKFVSLALSIGLVAFCLVTLKLLIFLPFAE